MVYEDKKCDKIKIKNTRKVDYHLYFCIRNLHYKYNE